MLLGVSDLVYVFHLAQSEDRKVVGKQAAHVPLEVFHSAVALVLGRKAFLQHCWSRHNGWFDLTSHVRFLVGVRLERLPDPLDFWPVAFVLLQELIGVAQHLLDVFEVPYGEVLALQTLLHDLSGLVIRQFELSWKSEDLSFVLVPWVVRTRFFEP